MKQIEQQLRVGKLQVLSKECEKLVLFLRLCTVHDIIHTCTHVVVMYTVVLYYYAYCMIT